MKAMLETQERAFNSALEIVVKQMNDHINKLEGKVGDLTTSLEYSQREIDDLKSTLKDHERENKENKTKLNELTEQLASSNMKTKELEDRINQQEDYSRRKNVRINGMEERDGTETWEQTAAKVTSVLEDKMQLSGLVLERAHRVGARREGKPRPIVARFSRYCDRDAVLRNGRKLKGTNIFVNEDLCAASQAIKSAQFPLMKQARAEGKIAFFRHTKLIIREKTDGGSAGPERRSAERGGAPGGAAGGGGGVPGPTAGGVVTGTQVAGAWSGTGAGEEPFPALAGARAGGSSLRTPAASVAASQRNTDKRANLRSSSKKK